MEVASLETALGLEEYERRLRNMHVCEPTIISVTAREPTVSIIYGSE